MEIQTHKANARPTSGTRVARKLRKTGMIPVVIYGHGEPTRSIALELHDITVALARGARTLNVELGDATDPYLIKAIQYDHLGTTPIHMDLTRVSMDERVKVHVGIELRGVPKGITEGGVLDQHMADIEIECLVMDIPEMIRPLVTELALGDSLLVKDLELPSGVTVVADPEERVATVRAMAAEAVPEDAAEEAEQTPEPERIGRIRKDEEAKGKSD